MTDETSASARLWRKLDALDLAEDERALLDGAFRVADAASTDDVSGFADLKGLSFKRPVPRRVQQDPEYCTGGKTSDFISSLESETGDE